MTKLRAAARWARKRAKRAGSHVWLRGLQVRNRLSHRSVLGDADVVVSLTTFGPRLASVAYTIESIAAGAVRPRQLVLWLDDPSAFAHRPANLRRLERRGLSVRLTENHGPHTKYVGALDIALAEDLPLVTADDDILYPPSWLRRLVEAGRAHPGVVSCYRASVVAVAGDRVAPYDEWPRCRSTEPSLAHFATGVAGVLYPRVMLEQLKQRGLAFVDRCLKADDIWLHWVALRSGVPVRQLSATPRHFPLLPGTQEQSLMSSNVHQRANDGYVAGLYEPADVAALVRAGAPVTSPAPTA